MCTYINTTITDYINLYVNKNDCLALERLSDWLNENFDNCNPIEKHIALLFSFVGINKKQSVCMFNVGNVLLNENYKYGLTLIENAAEVNYSKAVKFLASHYFDDDNKALDYWQQYLEISESDKGLAYQEIGRIYFFNEQFSYEKAAEYLFIAADKYDMPFAKYLVASMYFYGYSVEQNVEKALQYCVGSAELGCPDAQFWLGKDYYISDEFGLEQDLDKAKYYLTLAYEKNNKYAPLFLGLMYYCGDGVDISYSIAEKYLKEAEDNGVQLACGFLGHIYFEQGAYTAARLELEKSFFENGETTNLKYLAQIYKNGLQCRPNVSKAIECYDNLIARNEAEELDISYVADCYYMGVGVEKNIDKAVEYYKLICCDNAYASYQLGCIAADPTTSLNENFCIIYFEKAASMGFHIAYKKLGDYFKSINNLDRAYDFYLKSFESGNIESAFNLGQLHEQGTQLKPKNYIDAVKWYQKAADKGCQPAVEKLKHFKKTLWGYKKVK